MFIQINTTINRRNENIYIETKRINNLLMIVKDLSDYAVPVRCVVRPWPRYNQER